MLRTRRPHRSATAPGSRPLLRRLAALATVATLLLAALPAPALAAEDLTMTARAMLQGHARVGAWMAIEVHLENGGPPVVGELRVTGGGNQGLTRVGRLVEVPTQSALTFILFSQPAQFGGALTVELVADGRRIVSQQVTYQVHEAAQLTIAIVAERPQAIAGKLPLQAAGRGVEGKFGVAPVIMALTPADLPDRVEGWSGLDRLIWQDVDSSVLTTDQLEALTAWLVAGGRLIIVGGTSSARALSAFPDAILPYRPSATVDAPPFALGSLVTGAPADASDVPALAGDLVRGTALATVGDRTIAAETAYGSGAVSLIGVDLTASWLGESSGTAALWQRLLPARNNTGAVLLDDSQLVNAVALLPSLALPPIGWLLLLLGAYIVLIGPVNYLVLRRLDKREWAWVTMPALIALFAVAAFGFGALLRGTDVLLNEVAIVRGAPGATVGSAQVYVGVFSPTRANYDLEVTGGALLGSPLVGDFSGDGSPLDILQGDPSRVRGLAVGFGSLRTVRAETTATVPLVEVDVRLVDGVLTGTITNRSETRLARPAIVLGGAVAVLDDLEPGETQNVNLRSIDQVPGFSLADRILGQNFFGGNMDDETRTMLVRRAVIDQLTYDPQFGYSGALSADTAVLLAWGEGALLDVRVAGETPRRTGTTLYYLPMRMAISGTTTFGAGLIRPSVVAIDAIDFYRDPWSISLGSGSVTMAYRPLSLEGTFSASKVEISLGFGGDQFDGTDGGPIEPLDEIPVFCPQPPAEQPEGCVPVPFDGAPEVEVFDLVANEWRRLPHMTMGERRTLVEPTRYVDAATGTILVRFVAESQQHVGFSFIVRLTGDVG